MTHVYIKGIALGTKGACALCVKSDGRDAVMRSKSFDGILPTRYGGIGMIDGKGCYQTELYALVWGMTLIPPTGVVKVHTSSIVILDWVKERYATADYRSLFDTYLRLSENRDVRPEALVPGSNRTMNKVVDLALERCGEIGI